MLPLRYVHLHEMFCLNVFGPKNTSELLFNHLKYFRFWLLIRWDIWIFVHSAIFGVRKVSFRVFSVYRKFHFRVLSVYGQFHIVHLFWETFSEDSKYWGNSAFYLYTHSFILRMLSRQKVSFCIFYLYLNFILCIISICQLKNIYINKNSFHELSTNAKFFLKSSQILHMLSIC
jgi:hypothetical protein